MSRLPATCWCLSVKQSRDLSSWNLSSWRNCWRISIPLKRSSKSHSKTIYIFLFKLANEEIQEQTCRELSIPWRFCLLISITFLYNFSRCLNYFQSKSYNLSKTKVYYPLSVWFVMMRHDGRRNSEFEIKTIGAVSNFFRVRPVGVSR